MSDLATIVITTVLTTVAYRLVADLVVRPWVQRHKSRQPKT